MTTVQDTLRLFGITRCYKGFQHTAHAICLVVHDESRLEAVTKKIYMETASHFHCKWTAVERNIRTAAARAWKVNRPLLFEMAAIRWPVFLPPPNLLRSWLLTYCVYPNRRPNCGLLLCFDPSLSPFRFFTQTS